MFTINDLESLVNLKTSEVKSMTGCLAASLMLVVPYHKKYSGFLPYAGARVGRFFRSTPFPPLTAYCSPYPQLWAVALLPGTVGSRGRRELQISTGSRQDQLYNYPM